MSALILAAYLINVFLKVFSSRFLILIQFCYGLFEFAFLGIFFRVMFSLFNKILRGYSLDFFELPAVLIMFFLAKLIEVMGLFSWYNY